MANIYGVRANVRKSEGYAALSPSRKSPNIVSVIEKTVHNCKRRAQTPFYSEKGLKEVEERILEKIRTFSALLGPAKSDSPNEKGSTSWGPPKDMATLCSWLTNDIISDLCYGESHDMLRSSQQRWFPLAIRTMSQRSLMCVVQPGFYKYKIDRIFFAPTYKRILSAGTWAHERAAARVQLPNNIHKRDFFQEMMSAREPKSGMEFTLKDLWVESIILLAAGSDSTATAMSATFFYLAHCPRALALATAEVRQSFTDVEAIRRSPNLDSCNFLHACINEALRLIPSLPNVLPRTVNEAGIVIDGEFVPEGTTVGSSIYSVHRDPTYFKYPDRFWPERWILNSEPGVDEHSIAQAQEAFLPFSLGPRSCIGRRLAWTEVSIVLARTLYLYDLRLAPDADCCKMIPRDQDCEYPMKAFVVVIANGPRLQFRRRQG